MVKSVCADCLLMALSGSCARGRVVLRVLGGTQGSRGTLVGRASRDHLAMPWFRSSRWAMCATQRIQESLDLMPQIQDSYSFVMVKIGE